MCLYKSCKTWSICQTVPCRQFSVTAQLPRTVGTETRDRCLTSYNNLFWCFHCIWSLIWNNSFQTIFIWKQTIIADTFFIITCLYNDHLFVTWFLWNSYTLNVFLKWIHYHGAGPENKCVNINVYTFVFGFMYSVIHVIYYMLMYLHNEILLAYM